MVPNTMANVTESITVANQDPDHHGPNLDTNDSAANESANGTNILRGP
jgi:hypothetical protein